MFQTDPEVDEAMSRVTTLKEAIRAGVDLARSEWDHGLSENQKAAVDERIDRRIDKIKVWLFSGVVCTIGVNLIPLGIMAYQIGSFTSEMKVQMATLNSERADRYGRTEHDAYARQVDRRFDELEERADELESKVFKGK